MVQKHYLHLAWGLFITPIAVLATYAVALKIGEARATFDRAKWSENKRILNGALINYLTTDVHLIGSPIERFPELEDCSDYVVNEEKFIQSSISCLIAPEVLESTGDEKRGYTNRRGGNAMIRYEPGDRILVFELPESRRNTGTGEGFYPTAFVVYVKGDHILAIGYNGYTVIQ